MTWPQPLPRSARTRTRSCDSEAGHTSTSARFGEVGARDTIGFGLLGPVEGRLGDTPLDLGPRKQRLVLAALLLEANRPLSTERLVDLTWPHSPPPTART